MSPVSSVNSLKRLLRALSQLHSAHAVPTGSYMLSIGVVRHENIDLRLKFRKSNKIIQTVFGFNGPASCAHISAAVTGLLPGKH